MLYLSYLLCALLSLLTRVGAHRPGGLKESELSESVGSVDSDSESDGGEDLPRQWETMSSAQLPKETRDTGTDDIPYIGTDVQSESEEDNVKSQDIAENNTNQSNNVLLTAEATRTPLHCHHPFPIIRLFQGRTTLSSSSGRYPQFV